MSIRHLKIFLAVYQEKSITRAAEKLHIAQPSVSLAIKELEEFYGIKLFDRIGRRISVTELGEGYYEYASQIIRLFDEMEGKMTAPMAPFSIKIGSSITIGSFIIPEIVSRYRQQMPNGKVHVQVQNSKQIIQSVIKNDLDLGLVEDMVENEKLITIPFMKDELYFISSRLHPLAERKTVTLQEISKYPQVMREPGSASREIAEELWRSCQLRPEICWESVSNQSVIQAVKRNLGITVISKRLVREELEKGELVILPFYPQNFQRNFNLIYHKNKYMTPALKQFITLLKEETCQTKIY